MATVTQITTSNTSTDINGNKKSNDENNRTIKQIHNNKGRYYDINEIKISVIMIDNSWKRSRLIFLTKT